MDKYFMDFNREEDKILTSTSSIRTWDLWVQCFKLFHSGPEKTTDAKFIFAKEVNESFYSLKKNRVEDISFPAAVLGRRQHPKNGSSTAFLQLTLESDFSASALLHLSEISPAVAHATFEKTTSTPSVILWLLKKRTASTAVMKNYDFL